MSDWEIIEGDCLEVMHNIPDGSVDMILADLPYGTTACSWDVVIPLEPLWAHYKRVIKHNGAIVLFGSQPFTSALVMSNPKWFKYEWIWRKPQGTGHLNASRQPLKDHENILMFCSDVPIYDPQMGVGKPYKAFTGTRDTAQVYNEQWSIHNDNDGTRYPKTTLEFAQQRETLHPTQKPVALGEYLIRTYTNEGETVLDNTCGSGSTGEACIRTDRRFIGIENNSGYVAIARARLARVAAEPRQAAMTLEAAS